MRAHEDEAKIFFNNLPNGNAEADEFSSSEVTVNDTWEWYVCSTGIYSFVTLNI